MWGWVLEKSVLNKYNAQPFRLVKAALLSEFILTFCDFCPVIECPYHWIYARRPLCSVTALISLNRDLAYV